MNQSGSEMWIFLFSYQLGDLQAVFPDIAMAGLAGVLASFGKWEERGELRWHECMFSHPIKKALQVTAPFNKRLLKKSFPGFNRSASKEFHVIQGCFCLPRGSRWCECLISASVRLLLL